MQWQQLTITHSKKSPEELSDLLFGLGAVSVSLQDAGDEPLFEVELDSRPLWREVAVIALLEEEADPEQFFELLKNVAGDHAMVGSWEQLPEKDWVTAWKDQFTAIDFGHDLWICPSWLTPPDPNAHNIILDPGMAFGTGTHPTTALMLRYLAAHPPKDLTVIDYGCGSGILGIAAAMLGAAQVIGVDNDHNAVSATLENARINHLELESCLNTELVCEPVDIVLANILALPLVELAPTLIPLVKSQGQLILSGILANEQVEMVLNAYAADFTVHEKLEREGWMVLCLVKKVSTTER